MGHMVKHGEKDKISVSLDTELITWVDSMIGKRVFASRSHAIEVALQRLKERTKGADLDHD